MALITAEYRALNEKLHQDRPDYGMSGHQWAPLVLRAVEKYGLTSVLDYGAGKSSLRRALPPSYWDRGFLFMEYDPAVPELSEEPCPVDMVVCTDVLEHIEPDCLDAVLDDLKRCSRRFALINVATRKAKKTLADGRNAHLIVEPASWWLARLEARWGLVRIEGTSAGFMFFGEIK